MWRERSITLRARVIGFRTVVSPETAPPTSKREAVVRFGTPFWRLERAALRLETPESFRSQEGRETFALLTEVRQALIGRAVRDRRQMKPIKREF